MLIRCLLLWTASWMLADWWHYLPSPALLVDPRRNSLGPDLNESLPACAQLLAFGKLRSPESSLKL
jgi:hypothetical protein